MELPKFLLGDNTDFQEDILSFTRLSKIHN
jgi:hypothetical protein